MPPSVQDQFEIWKSTKTSKLKKISNGEFFVECVKNQEFSGFFAFKNEQVK